MNNWKNSQAIKKDKTYYIYILFLIFALVLYGNTIGNGYSIDDDYVVQNNPKVMKGISGIAEILTSRYETEEGNTYGYRPVAIISYALENELWGQDAKMSHSLNVIFYCLILFLLFVVLRKVFCNVNTLFIVVIVLLFAAHPLHTEVVASLKNRETLLSFLFSLLSLLLFLKWVKAKRIVWIAGGVFTFILAFLSKQDAITFAAIIPLSVFFSLNKKHSLTNTKRITKKLKVNPLINNLFQRFSELTLSGLLLNILPFMLLAAAGILAYKVPNLYLPAETKVVYNFENPQFTNHSGYPTLPLAFYTIFFYLKKLIIPHPLGFYYGFKMIPEVSWLMPEVILSVVFSVGIVSWALYRLPKKHILSYAILYYLMTISIFTNLIIKIPGIVGERLAFFASLGFCIALAWGIFKLMRIPIEARHYHQKKVQKLVVVMLLILIPYSVKTITRNAQWENYLSLYSHDIKYLANSAKANNIYANQLLKEAFDPESRKTSPKVQQRHLQLAYKHIKKSVEIDPTFKFAWNNLGYLALNYMNQPNEGVIYLQKAVSIDPEYTEAWFNLATAYQLNHKFNESEQALNTAMSQSPDNNYLTQFANFSYRHKDYARAIAYYNRAIENRSGQDAPFVGLANCYWMQNDTMTAIKYWEKAFEINPRNLAVCQNLAGYFRQKGGAKADYYSRKLSELTQE